MTTEQDVSQPSLITLPLDKQFELKEYLNRFFEGIYETKLRIQMHIEISNTFKLNNMKHKQFWGFFQNNVNLSLIVARMFSIFDENNKHILKKFIRFLRSLKIYNLTELDAANWIRELEPYEGFWNGIIAHTDLIRSFVPKIPYDKFIHLLNQLECKLTAIRAMYITHNSVINGEWAVSELNLECGILSELRQLL